VSRADTLDWLAALQARFTSVLRTPLDRTSGTLAAQRAQYDERACADVAGAARERLAVYNRQYWFRLFSALQSDFMLTARLFGYWEFNAHASRYFERRPPSSYDLAEASAGFLRFLEEALAAEPESHALPRRALLEAARIDVAFRVVLRAAPEPRLELTADDAARLPEGRLVRSQALALVEEHWPLLALRRSASDDKSERPLALPAPHASPRSWALVRTEQGHGLLPLDSVQARLLALLDAHPVAEALARIEADPEAGDRATLPARTQRWLAEGMRLGFWTRLDPGAAP
jgi:hypothetical protein